MINRKLAWSVLFGTFAILASVWFRQLIGPWEKEPGEAMAFADFLGAVKPSDSNSPGSLRELDGFYRPSYCGPIALLAICRFYGVEARLDELATLSGVDRKGTSVAGLIH